MRHMEYPERRWELGPWDEPSVSLGASTVTRVDTSREAEGDYAPPRPAGFTADLGPVPGDAEPLLWEGDGG